MIISSLLTFDVYMYTCIYKKISMLSRRVRQKIYAETKYTITRGLQILQICLKNLYYRYVSTQATCRSRLNLWCHCAVDTYDYAKFWRAVDTYDNAKFWRAVDTYDNAKFWRAVDTYDNAKFWRGDHIIYNNNLNRRGGQYSTSLWFFLFLFFL